MRRAAKQDPIYRSSPMFLIASGFERFGNDISKHTPAPQRKSKYDDKELAAMQRSPKRTRSSGSLFSNLMQQLVWDRS